MSTKYQEWAFSVGHFVLTFGALDHQVFEFLQDHLSAEDYAAAKQEPFKQRFKLAGRILEKSPDAHRKFSELSERLEPLRELRNHIAHGHLLAQIQGDPKHTVVTIARAKDQDVCSDYTSSGVSPNSINRATRDLGAALEDFYQLAAAVHRSHDQIPFK